MKLTLIYSLLFFSPSPDLPTLENWSIVANKSQINFTMKHKKKDLEGKVEGLQGTIQFSENDLVHSSIKVAVAVNTIDTGVTDRDEHLRKGDFFDAVKFPQMSFESTGIRKAETGFVADGILKIKDQSKVISLPFTFESTGDKNGIFSGSFTLNRMDFGVGNRSDGIENEVTVTFMISVKS